VIEVEPMGNMPVLKDLIVDMDEVHWKKIRRVTPWLVNKQPIPKREYLVPHENMIDVTQTMACIQCGACVSDCLSMEVDPLFIGPAALAKSYRFVGDPRDAEQRERLVDLSEDEHGIYDCTHCFNCIDACPKGVAPMSQIIRLRRIAGTDHEIEDRNNGHRHERAFVKDAAWRLFEGEAVFTGGEWWGATGFSDPRQSLDRDDPRYEPTGKFLEELEPGIVERLVTGDERTAAALTQRRWERAVAAAEDPAQRLTLAMRTLEEALPIPRAAGGSVRESCERYLMETWSMATLHRQLRDAAYYGTGSALRPGASRERTELRNAILPSTGDLSFTFKPRTFMQRIAEVLSGLDESTMQHRMVAEAAAWVSSGSAMAAHIEELDARFRRLLTRTIRQRNAVVHGAQTVPQVIASCEPFIRELCGQVVAQALDAAANGEDPLDRLESARTAWLRQRAALRDGKPPAAVVFAGRLIED
jgi:ferredoxin